jgi:hypothetical protein
VRLKPNSPLHPGKPGSVAKIERALTDAFGQESGANSGRTSAVILLWTEEPFRASVFWMGKLMAVSPVQKSAQFLILIVGAP